MTTMTPAPISEPRRDDAYDVATVLTLMLGGFVVPVVGWIAGVILLWAGERWSTGTKWLATLVWPAVVVVPLLGFVAVGAATNDAGWGFLAAAILGVVTLLGLLPAIFVHMLRSGRR